MVPDHLRGAGLRVVTHHGRFRDNAPDHEWLAEAGRRRWVVITKDQNIRKRPLEKQAIAAAKVRAFVVTAGQISGVEIGEILTEAIPKIGRILDETPAPFVARITAAGDVAVVAEADDE